MGNASAIEPLRWESLDASTERLGDSMIGSASVVNIVTHLSHSGTKIVGICLNVTVWLQRITIVVFLIVGSELQCSSASVCTGL